MKSKKNLKVHFSSKSDEWSTPQWLFDKLNTIFGPFDLDAAASDKNHKCERYFTNRCPQTSALHKNWFKHGSKVFVNPPYSMCKEFMERAWSESLLGGINVVCLVPARTDTKWFHDYVMDKASVVIFIKGRLKFGDSKNSAPFPSMLVVYNNTTKEPKQTLFSTMSNKC